MTNQWHANDMLMTYKWFTWNFLISSFFFCAEGVRFDLRTACWGETKSTIFMVDGSTPPVLGVGLFLVLRGDRRGGFDGVFFTGVETGDSSRRGDFFGDGVPSARFRLLGVSAPVSESEASDSESEVSDSESEASRAKRTVEWRFINFSRFCTIPINFLNVWFSFRRCLQRDEKVTPSLWNWLNIPNSNLLTSFALIYTQWIANDLAMACKWHMKQMWSGTHTMNCQWLSNGLRMTHEKMWSGTQKKISMTYKWHANDLRMTSKCLTNDT